MLQARLPRRTGLSPSRSICRPGRSRKGPKLTWPDEVADSIGDSRPQPFRRGKVGNSAACRVYMEQANRGKHGVDFRTAAKVLLDRYVIEYDDLDAIGELRFNAIGLVDGRMLFATCAMRGDVVRIVSARGAELHKKGKYHGT
jgi:uncharacterized protein